MIFIVFIADNIISFTTAVIITSRLLIAVPIISLLGYCGYDIAVILPVNTTFGFFKIAI
jgi:hypothetical protein